MPVYFIQAAESGRIKIGHSHRPAGRLAKLQPWSPEPLRLMIAIEGGEALERALHRQFSACRRHGEWFDPHPDLLAYIGQLTGMTSAGATEGVTKVAVRAAGGPKAVAGHFGIRSQAVSQWRRVPADRVLRLERLSGISRAVLRPDLYPRESGRAA